MREIFDMVVAEIRGSWRYRWLAVGIAWLIALLGWSVVYLIPNEYESSATVLFDTTSELDELLESMTVSADPLSRTETVRTALLGRTALEQVARDTGLYGRAQSENKERSLIPSLRSRITIYRDSQRGANLYEISYRDEDPEMTKAVVSTLLDNFVQRTLGANREGTQRAQQFLRKELDELEAALTQAEQRLADFKRENVGRMPGEAGDYFERLQSEMAALDATRTEMRRANRQEQTLSQQLSGERTDLQSATVQSDLDIRIANNEQRLEELRLRFTDRHPDVIALRDTLSQLREQKEEQLAAARSSSDLGVISDNPVLQNIQIELSKVNVLIASLREQERTHLRKIAELEELVDVLPQVEAELARLNRDYEVKQAQYNSLLQRLEIAELSESAELSENVEFQIIEPPLEPIAPVAPRRDILLAAVLAMSLGAGGGLAFLGNQLKPVFTSSRSIRDVTGLPVIGAVQVMITPKRRWQRRLQLGSFALSVTALCLVFVGVFLLRDQASEMARTFVERL